jgi:hypothetical protein
MKPARYQANKDGRYWPELSIALPSFHSFQPPQFYSTEAYILKNMQASYPPLSRGRKRKKEEKRKRCEKYKEERESLETCYKVIRK